MPAITRACSLFAWLSAVALAAAPEVIPEKRSVVLGDQPQLSVRVLTHGMPGRLKGAASHGDLVRGDAGGEDEARYTWTLPDTRVPTVALLLFWLEEDDTAPDVGYARVSLIGRTELEIETERGAEVRVRVGQRVFGPVNADAAGRAKVPIEVPPGVQDATVLGQRQGQQTELLVPLGVPPFNPLTAILGPDPFYAEGEGWLWVFDSSEFYTDKLEVVLTGGDARLTDTTRRGTLFVITPAPRARRISATASAKGAPHAQAQVSTTLVRGPRPEAPPPRRGAPLRGVNALAPGALIGGFYGGGANLGWLGSVQLGWYVWPRLSFELEVGVRRGALEAFAAPLGDLQSSVTALHALAAVRWRALEVGPWALDLRAGGGALPFVHVVSSTFQPTFSETALGGELFAGAEVSYRVGPVRLFLDARGGHGQARTPRLDARPGGLILAFGARGGP